MELNYPLSHKFLDWMINRITSLIKYNLAHDILQVYLCVAHTLLCRPATRGSDRLTHIKITRLHHVGEVDPLAPRVLLLDAVVIAQFLVAKCWVNHLYECVADRC